MQKTNANNKIDLIYLFINSTLTLSRVEASQWKQCSNWTVNIILSKAAAWLPKLHLHKRALQDWPRSRRIKSNCLCSPRMTWLHCYLFMQFSANPQCTELPLSLLSQEEEEAKQEVKARIDLLAKRWLSKWNAFVSLLRSHLFICLRFFCSELFKRFKFKMTEICIRNYIVALGCDTTEMRAAQDQ